MGKSYFSFDNRNLQRMRRHNQINNTRSVDRRKDKEACKIIYKHIKFKKFSNLLQTFFFNTKGNMSLSKQLPYKYINLSSINEYLRCYICHYPLLDPVTSPDGRCCCRSCYTGNESDIKSVNERIVLQMLDDIPVQCLRCDETNIKRGDFQLHEQNFCKQAEVPCKSADIKCPWIGTRQELGAHLKDCVYEPLRPALSEIINENKQFHEKISKLESLVRELKERI
jgi:formylmethanofuran dehydrogenase subunit E